VFKTVGETEEESGVSKASTHPQVRKAFLGAGGDRAVSKKTEMLRFLNGTNTQAPTAMVAKDIEQLKGRRKKQEQSKLLKAVDVLNRVQPGRLNLFDYLDTISRGNKGSVFKTIQDDIVAGEVKTAKDDGEIRALLEKLNPNGKHTSKVMNTTVTVDTPSGKMKMSLGEIIMLDMAMENKQNELALVKNSFRPESTKDDRTFKASSAQYRAMIDDALSRIDQKTMDSYNKAKEVYGEAVRLTGERVKPVADEILKRRGEDREFELVGGNYVPIMTQDAVDGDSIEVKVPNSSGGTETQTVKDNFINREIHKGKYQERTGGTKDGRVRVGTIDSVLSNLINTSTEFSGKGLVNDDILRLLSNKELQTAITSGIGSKFLDNMKEKAYQSTGNLEAKRRTRLDKIISWGFGLADTWRLSRLSTGTIMAASSQMIRPYLNAQKSFTKGVSNVLNPFILKKFSEDPYIKRRYASQSFSPELSEKGTKLKVISGGKTLESVSGDVLSAGDRTAIATVFSSSAFDVLSERGIDATVENLKKQDAKFWEDVSNKAAGLILKTQPSGSASAVSTWKGRSRNSLPWRIFTRYGSQASRIYNNVIDAVEDHAYEGTAESRKKLTQVVEAQIVTNTLALSAIKTTRRATKIAFLLSVFGATMSPEEKEEMKDKKDEEIDKMVATFFKNVGKNLARTIEGADELMQVYEFLAKQYVDEPFGGVATSEMKEMKGAVGAYKSMKKYEKQLESGVATRMVDGEEREFRLSRKQRKAAEKSYADAAERFLKKSRNTALFLSRIPAASIADVSVVEAGIARKMAESKNK
jgi:hypothetical protein